MGILKYQGLVLIICLYCLHTSLWSQGSGFSVEMISPRANALGTDSLPLPVIARVLSSQALGEVTLLADGTPHPCSDTQVPCVVIDSTQEYAWSLSLTAGQHQLSMQATDAQGVSVQSPPITVQVLSTPQAHVPDALEPNNTPQEAREIPCGSSIVLSALPSDVDWFVVPASSEEGATISAVLDSPGLASFDVYNDTGSSLILRGPTNVSQAQMAFPAGSHGKLSIKAATAQGVLYRLSVQCGASVGTNISLDASRIKVSPGCTLISSSHITMIGLIYLFIGFYRRRRNVIGINNKGNG